MTLTSSNCPTRNPTEAKSTGSTTLKSTDDGSTNELVEYLRSKNVIIDTANRPHHVTHDLVLANGFKVRIEDEPLLEKIKREEIK